MIYRYGKPIKKDRLSFARVVLWTIILGSLAALTIYVILLRIDSDLRHDIEMQEQTTNQRLQPEENNERH